MPGFTTHYLFGLNTFKLLPNTDLLKKTISNHHAAFSLGLQGPDIFFYFLPSYLIFKENPGSKAHIDKTNTFLSYLLKSYRLFQNEEESSVVKAYISGFLGHYILDCNCHPYIYAKTKYKKRTSKYYGHHINLEVEIDTKLLEQFKKMKPSAFRQASTIKLTLKQLDAIAFALYYTYSMTYPNLNIKYRTIRLAIRFMQIGTHLLRDPHGKKKILIRKIESIFIGYPVLSPIIPSNHIRFFSDPLNTLHKKWQNPWDNSHFSHESFLDLLKKSKNDYLKILKLSDQLFESNDQNTIYKELLNKLGNNSYHSGLDSSINS